MTKKTRIFVQSVVDKVIASMIIIILQLMMIMKGDIQVVVGVAELDVITKTWMII
ncbi:MAG: hypothetical protein IKW08_04295 [Roseburia sp.]|nr:hypothetical protein [Roseburia sp.]